MKVASSAGSLFTTNYPDPKEQVLEESKKAAQGPWKLKKDGGVHVLDDPV